MSDSITVTGTRRSPWRSPRCRLLVNGVEQSGFGVLSFSLDRTRYGRCDTLTLELAFDRSVTQAPYWFDVSDPASGSTLSDIDIQLQMRDEESSGSQWTAVFQGIVDNVAFRPFSSSVSVTCRDYLAKLMDMRVMDTWLNLTGTELLKSVITAAGLTPNVTVTTGYEGQFWQIEHKRHAAAGQHRFQTAFDLVRYVANGSNCDFYADGKTIVVAPYPSSDDATAHSLKYSDPGGGSPIVADFWDANFGRDYQTAKGVVVHCLSWDSKQRIKSEVYFSALGAGKKNALANGTMHSFKFPGLKQDQLQAKAEALYRQIVAHGRDLTFTVHGRASLAPRQFMTLTGTGTTWDGTHDVDAVSSTFGWDQGYTQNVTLRTRDTTDDESSEYD
ncbi:hypothetical protein J2D73_18410 [Acetobacter sacchari]|uniref:Uncharacterized protein n=1 Tax=Acetobacter sacchari TaxID=2661687 RepID=A0ABS3M0U0_9PROT|nr:hypothetical protein [Acetobacter sacchari]MBO1361758.1 hypothetical protein [Acetobacter sacchari]